MGSERKFVIGKFSGLKNTENDAFPETCTNLWLSDLFFFIFYFGCLGVRKVKETKRQPWNKNVVFLYFSSSSW